MLYDRSNLTGPRPLPTRLLPAKPSSPLPPQAPHSHELISQRRKSAGLHSAPQYPFDECRRAEFQLSPADESARARQPAERERHAPDQLEAELQVNYNLGNATSHGLSNFPGIEGNTFTRGQSVMIGLTQNWTKTFMHTSQLYFSRSRALGLNEFSNVQDIGSQLGLTGISTAPLITACLPSTSRISRD